MDPGWHDGPVQCDYFDAGACRSCTLMGVPYADQLAAKQGHVAQRLAEVAPELTWEPPFASSEDGFRNKAKLVVGGRPGDITLGILDADGRGVDLRSCGLYSPELARSFAPVKAWLDRLQVPPYDVPRRRGEIKHVLVTVNPRGELMVRLVLRTDRHLERLRSDLPRLQAALPSLRVLSVNLQPEHKAVIEGAVEEVVTEHDHLVMDVAGLPLRLRPHSFFQTSTRAAEALYESAGRWIRDVAPASVLDLYCGVGGFALTAAGSTRGMPVHGIEIAQEAVVAARQAATDLDLDVRFTVGDASGAVPTADLVIVNPPRRGIGPLAETLEAGDARWIIYSSCNVESLARDLEQMTSWRPVRARLVDMFPQTDHHEVIVLLERGAEPPSPSRMDVNGVS